MTYVPTMLYILRVDREENIIYGVMRDKIRHRFCIVLVVVSLFKRGVMRSVMRDKIITHWSLYVVIGAW